MTETCDAAGCCAAAALRIVNTRGYELALACNDHAWRFETRTYPIDDDRAFDKAQPPEAG